MAEMALFPVLLADAFGMLAAPVRRMHRGVAVNSVGRASVQRGAGLFARLACAVAHLPPSGRDVPLRFNLEIEGVTERWTRWFGSARAMTSLVWVANGCLRERLGPAVTDFVLNVQEGVLLWEAVRLRVLGVTIPRRWFEVRARVSGQGDRYRFEISARLAGVGELIAYDGELYLI
jgi:Domain of unknown function (DUF4166)